MKNNLPKLITILLILILLCPPGFAQSSKNGKKKKPKKTEYYDKIIVSASRVEEDASKIANDITVVTEEEIKEQKLNTVVDVLRRSPDISVAQNGAYGGLTSIYLRGVPTGQTLVMINGMRVYDPMSFDADASFNAGHISTDNIERIEILKGPQSVLYGSHAIGGAINIITKRGKGRPRIEIDGELGSWRTKQGYAQASGSAGPFDFSFATSGMETDGISKVNERENQGERDYYKRYDFDGRLDWNVMNWLSLGSEMRYNYAWMKLDQGANLDDPNQYSDSETFLSATYLDAVPFEWWKSTASFAFLRNRRSGDDDRDANDRNLVYDFFHGKNLKVQWQNSFFIYDLDTLTAGLEFEHEQGNSHRSSTNASGVEAKTTVSKKWNETKSLYVNNVWHYWGLYVTTGIRVDKHSRWGTQEPYRLAAAYDFDWEKLEELGLVKGCKFWSDLGIRTKIRGSYATGFKGPSLYQLYSAYGNLTLQPEKSWGWDAGIEQKILGDILFAELTYFDNNIKNLINYDSVSQRYANEGSAEISGYEFAFHFIPAEWLKIRGGYTYYTKIENKITHERLDRRPKDKFDMNINWQIFEYPLIAKEPMIGSVNFDTTYVGNRYSKASSPTRWELLQNYWKFDAVFDLQIIKAVSVYYKIDNITDRFYEDVYGYATLPRNHTVGLKIKGEF